MFFLILLFAGCGTPEDYAIKPVDQGSNFNSAINTNSSGYSSNKKGPQIYFVEIKNMAFNPSELEVHMGDTVVWNNQDMVVHCVSQDPGKSWTSSEIQPGASWKMVAKKSDGFYCSIHHVMKGKIIVAK